MQRRKTFPWPTAARMPAIVRAPVAAVPAGYADGAAFHGSPAQGWLVAAKIVPAARPTAGFAAALRRHPYRGGGACACGRHRRPAHRSGGAAPDHCGRIHCPVKGRPKPEPGPASPFPCGGAAASALPVRPWPAPRKRTAEGRGRGRSRVCLSRRARLRKPQQALSRFSLARPYQRGSVSTNAFLDSRSPPLGRSDAAAEERARRCTQPP